jgi:hypothetical protein
MACAVQCSRERMADRAIHPLIRYHHPVKKRHPLPEKQTSEARSGNLGSLSRIRSIR